MTQPDRNACYAEALQNLEAERSVLAGLMHSNAAVERVADWLKADDFGGELHRVIYTAVLTLTETNCPADPLTVQEWIQGQGGPNSHNAAVLALDIAGEAYTSASVVAHAEIVLERSRMRKLNAIGSALIDATRNPNGEVVATIVARASLALGELSVSSAGGLIPYKARQKRVFEALIQRHTTGSRIGLPTPWPEVDEAIGALRDGDLIVLGARSNMGKSVTGFQIGRHTALTKKRVAVFSLEMDEEAVIYRDHAALGEVPMTFFTREIDDRFRASDDYDTGWARAQAAMRDLQNIDLLLDTDPQLTSTQITARAKRAHRQKPLDLIVIDHLHEVALPGVGREDQELGQAVSDFAALAKHCDCPVVLLAQINRSGDKAERPVMKHLQGAGKIEQRADLVLLLHRWDYYDPADRPGLVEVIVAKGRNVRTGQVINLRNRFDIMRADSWSGPAPIAREESEDRKPTPQRSRRPSFSARDYGRD